MYLSSLKANSAQKLAKKHILGNLILPNFSYFGSTIKNWGMIFLNFMS